MSAFWVTFEDGKQMCVEGKDVATATERAKTARGPVKRIDTLPYPAEPRLQPHEELTLSDGSKGMCPSLCYSPKSCAGRTSCPMPYACSE